MVLFGVVVDLTFAIDDTCSLNNMANGASAATETTSETIMDKWKVKIEKNTIVNKKKIYIVYKNLIAIHCLLVFVTYING